MTRSDQPTDRNRQPSGRGSTRASRDERAAGRRTPAGEWREAERRIPEQRRQSASAAQRPAERAGRRTGTALLDPQQRTGSHLITDERDPLYHLAAAPRVTETAPRTRPETGPKKQQKPAKSLRGRRQRTRRLAPGRPDNRIKIVLGVLVFMLTAAAIRLTFIQGWDSDAYASNALDQRSRTTELAAARGDISDRTGTQLAFTVEGKAIAGRPQLFATDVERQQVVDILVASLGAAVDGPALLAQLKSDDKYVYLARGLMPADADAIMAKIKPVLATAKKAIGDDYVNAVVTEPQNLREYPNGDIYRTVVGDTSDWDGNGTMGIENRFNALLAGTPGSRTVDVYPGGVIPGSARNETAAVAGSDLTLTLDSDLQYSVTQKLQSYVDQTRAKGGMAMVEDVKTGQVYAISTYTPGVDESANIAVTSPFEPGSVNKVVTFAAALEAGLITPTTVSKVDDSIQLGGRTIHDAWSHGTIDMTATGILAKSSNVGTLQLSQQIGPDKFAAELTKFGLGSKTGIELSGEARGVVPDQAQWSSTTFANLPIGQGLSMTLVQMASMYQAIGNGGVKLPPTLVLGTTTDGTYNAAPQAAGSTVMSEQTADTLLGMLRGTTQDGDVGHKGTATGAAIPGYQVAGKTGTAQQVDPVTKDYSDTMYTSTFAGLIPADNPRFVVAIMLDASQDGKNAVPLFHDIAAYAMRAFDVPPSAEPAPVYDLYVNY